MKKSLTALALALALTGTLAACSTDKNPNGGTADNNGATGGASGTNGTSGTASGSMNGTGGTASGSMNGTTGSASGTPGTVSRRYGGQSVYNGRIYDNPTYFEDGRYAAGADGRVYDNNGSAVSRDLTRGARDIVRGAGDAVEDVGRGIGNAARDITGTNANPGTPSWEPDSSAVRY